MKSTFIIILFLLVLPRNALFCKGFWGSCSLLWNYRLWQIRSSTNSLLRYFGIRGIADTSLSLPIADLLPKRRNAQNRFPLYGFGAILGVFFRYERLCFSGGILTVRHSQAAVCHFRVTKKRRIATTLLSCSEDGARERYSIICCTFSFCWQPLYQWQHRRWQTAGQSTVQGCLYHRSADSYRMFPVWYWQAFFQEPKSHLR